MYFTNIKEKENNLLCNSEMAIEIITLVNGLFEDVCSKWGCKWAQCKSEYMVGLDLDLIKICVPHDLD